MLDLSALLNHSVSELLFCPFCLLWNNRFAAGPVRFYIMPWHVSPKGLLLVTKKQRQQKSTWGREKKTWLFCICYPVCHCIFFTSIFLFFIHIFFFCDFFPHSLNFLQMCIFLLYYFSLTIPCSSLLSQVYASPPISWSFALSPAVSSIHPAPSWRFLFLL